MKKRRKGNQNNNGPEKLPIWVPLVVFGTVILVWVGALLLFGNGISKWNFEEKGQFGDMFGVINALFGGLAFGGVIFTILLQRKELQLQREELEKTREEFSLQNETLKKQRFENTFFQMLGLHHEIVSKLTSTKKGQLFQGRRYFQLIYNRFKTQPPYWPSFAGIKDPMEKMQSAFKKLFDDEQDQLGHYFRNLYHLYRFVHLSDLLSNEEFPDEEKSIRRFYCELVNAQLSSFEQALLFYNLITPNLGFPKFRYLADKNRYDILENFNIDLLLEPNHKIFYDRHVVNEDPFA